MGRARGVWRSLGVLVVLILLPLSVFAADRAKWPHETSDLEPDDRIVWGALDNGFRYALLPHASKPGIVSMRLSVGVGSLDEEDDERGLAHFIEHMAFEGTRNFKSGELIAFFQRLGMGYGVDVNAFTHHDKTVYHLELPQNDADLVENALRLYRDYADGILFDPARVENEREVILREKQARDSPSARISESSFRFSFEGTKLAERNPIGLEWVVKESTVDSLKAFYRKWYRPELMTLVIVGDIDPEALARQIDDAFSSLQSSKERLPKRKIGKLSRSKPFRTGQQAVEGVERYTLEVSRTWMESSKSDRWERRKLDTLRSFATALFDERCRSLVDGMGDNFANYNRVYGIPYCQLAISSGGDFWWDAFVWMDQLLRQAITFGFGKDEVEYVRKTWLQASRSKASFYQSAEPRLLIDDLVESIAQGRVYVSSQVFSERIDEYVKSITVEDVNKAFAEVWNLKKMSYFMAGDVGEVFEGKSLKRRIVLDRRYAVAPYVPKFPEAFVYSEFSNAGSVESVTDIEGVGARAFRFSNNARLTFLRTENEKDAVRVIVRVGGGLLGFSDTNPGTHTLAMPALFRSGIRGRPIEDVFKELRSNVTSFTFGVEDHDAFAFRGLSQADGIDDFFKIVAEYLLDPRVDEAAFVVAKSKLMQSRELEADGMKDGYRALDRLIYPGQPRFHSASLSDISNAQRDAVQSWIVEPFKNGYLEVAVVGDIEEAELVELFADTLGALPTRRAMKQGFEESRSMLVEPAAGKKTILYENGKGDSSASVLVWPIEGKLSVRESAALYVLSSVFESRIRERVREEMGASYSPSVRYVTFSAYNRLRYLRADVDCLKEDAQNLLDVVLGLCEDFNEKAVTEQELRAAVAPLEESLKQAWKDNSYLVENVLAGVQEYPEMVENAVKYREGLLSSLSVEELGAVARKFLAKERSLAVAIVPADKPSIAGPSNRLEEQRVGVFE